MKKIKLKKRKTGKTNEKFYDRFKHNYVPH